MRVRQSELLDPISSWLGQLFAPDQRDRTIELLVGAAAMPSVTSTRAANLQSHLQEARTRLSRLYASIEAGVDPVGLAPRIQVLQSEMAAISEEMAAQPDCRSASRQDIEAMVDLFETSAAEVFGGDADPGELREFFEAAGLSVEYDPRTGRVEAQIQLGPSAPPPSGTEGGGKERG